MQAKRRFIMATQKQIQAARENIGYSD